MDHLDTTSDKSRNSRLVKRALRAASKNQARLALTCVLATTLPIGMGTLVANAASVSHQTVTGVKSTFSPQSTTTKKPLLLAAVAEDNQDRKSVV